MIIPGPSSNLFSFHSISSGFVQAKASNEPTGTLIVPTCCRILRLPTYSRVLRMIKIYIVLDQQSTSESVEPKKNIYIKARYNEEDVLVMKASSQSSRSDHEGALSRYGIPLLMHTLTVKKTNFHLLIMNRALRSSAYYYYYFLLDDNFSYNSWKHTVSYRCSLHFKLPQTLTVKTAR